MDEPFTCTCQMKTDLENSADVFSFFKDYVVQDNEFYDQLLSKLTSFNLNVCVKLHPRCV